jgi:hypothetical protein
MSLKDIQCQCKLTLHWQSIRIIQLSISYQESGVKWDDMAENMIMIGWQCKIVLYCVHIFFFL